MDILYPMDGDDLIGKEVIIDLSQNVKYSAFRTDRSPCVTPHAKLWARRLGRPLVGKETVSYTHLRAHETSAHL
eukprot:12261810-Alexandrium_andersonii.AAC.1